MLIAVLDVLAVVSLVLGSIIMTISVYGVFRMPDVYSQLHAAGMASGLGAITILLENVPMRALSPAMRRRMKASAPPRTIV